MKCSRCYKEHSTCYKTCDDCREYNKKYRSKKDRQYKQGYCVVDDTKKKCSDCNTIKLLDKFYANKRYKDGYRNQCIDCHLQRGKTYYNNGYNIVLKNKLNDSIYRLKQNQKSYLHQQLKAYNLTKVDSTNKYIGCSIDHLYKWLSFLLKMYPEMSWDNRDWHIDHVIPISLFDLTKEDQVKIAFNWTNMQPLPKRENLQKSNNFRMPEFCNHVINLTRFASATSQKICIKDKTNFVKHHIMQHD
jgi:hypothetical protein